LPAEFLCLPIGSSILSYIPRECQVIIDRSRAGVACLPNPTAIGAKPAPRCRTSCAGLPTNPENNYQSAIQPEHTGRMVNRLPGRKPVTAVAFTINGKAVILEGDTDTTAGGG